MALSLTSLRTWLMPTQTATTPTTKTTSNSPAALSTNRQSKLSGIFGVMAGYKRSTSIFSLTEYRMAKKKYPVDEALLTDQRKDLARVSTGNGAHYRLFDKDMNAVHKDSESCYGQFHYIVTNGFAKKTWQPEVMIICDPTSAKTEASKAFIDWCINTSPYADVFLDKDPDSVTKLPAVLSTHHHPRMVIGAAILIRYRAHLASRVSTWHQFVKHGVNPTLAFVLCNIFSTHTKLGFVKDMDGGGHGLWHPAAWKNTLRNFLAGKIDHNKPAEHTVHNGYYSYTGLWNVWGTVAIGSKEDLIAIPETNAESNEKTGWGNETQKIGYYSWEKLDEFIEQFLKINKANGAYEKALKVA